MNVGVTKAHAHTPATVAGIGRRAKQGRIEDDDALDARTFLRLQVDGIAHMDGGGVQAGVGGALDEIDGGKVLHVFSRNNHIGQARAGRLNEPFRFIVAVYRAQALSNTVPGEARDNTAR